MKAATFHAHCIEQITGRLALRAREKLFNGEFSEVLEIGIQFIYNVCGAAVYANLPKEKSYDKITGLKVIISANDKIHWKAITVCDTLDKLSKEFKNELADFEFSPSNIKV